MNYDTLVSIDETLEQLAGMLTEATLKRKPKHYKTNKRFRWGDKSIPAGGRWVTIRGSRVYLNRKGKAILPRGLAKKLGPRGGKKARGFQAIDYIESDNR